jgi:hypothetical protein
MNDYCKGQMRTPARKTYRGSLSGLVTIYVYVCPVCKGEYSTEQTKPDFITLRCREVTTAQSEKIAA